MDSDDEFMSGLSSQEEAFGEDQDSDDGSLGDGAYLRSLADGAQLQHMLADMRPTQNSTKRNPTLGFLKTKT